MSCMGPISAALKSCVKPFDRSMYAATILHVWQKCSSSPLSMVLFLFVVLVGSSAHRSEEHTSELQSLMRISYAVFCLKKKNITTTTESLIIIIKNTKTNNYTL